MQQPGHKVFSVRHVNYGRLEHQKTVEGSLADVKLKLIYPTAFTVLLAFKGTPLIICTYIQMYFHVNVAALKKACHR